jgi:hypothetical protein
LIGYDLGVAGVARDQGPLTDEVGVGLLTAEFPPVVVDRVLEATGRREQRVRLLPARLVVYFTLAMWLHFGVGYVRVLERLVEGLRWARGGYGAWSPAGDGAISRAREKLGAEPVRLLFEQAAAAGGGAVLVEEAGWRGLRVVAVDGLVLDAADTEENRACYQVPAGGSYPQVRAVALAECGTLQLLGAAFDSSAVGERELMERLLPCLGADMVVLADRGFPSYALFTAAAATGAQLAWRVSAAFTLPVLEKLADGSYLSELKGRRAHQRAAVRVVEYSVRDEDGTSEVFCLITTLLAPEQAPALELALLYGRRWTAELLIHALKVDLRTSGAVLRSRHPWGVEQEVWAMLCTYQAVRRVITRAAVEADLDPGRISFPKALDSLRASARRAFSP